MIEIQIETEIQAEIETEIETFTVISRRVNPREPFCCCIEGCTQLNVTEPAQTPSKGQSKLHSPQKGTGTSLHIHLPGDFSFIFVDLTGEE